MRSFVSAQMNFGVVKEVSSGDRYVPLEFLRGFAAIIVFIDHFFLLFIPQLTGVYDGEKVLADMQRNSSVWIPLLFQLFSPVSGSPVFSIFNGSAAVQFFFVLSAYVLTTRYFQTGKVRLLWLGAIKRWFRLMGPVLMSILISYGFMKAKLYCTDDVADIVISTFLSTQGRISPHLGQIGPNSQPDPNFFEAFLQGSVLTFFRGDTTYLASMWIIRYDFFGAQLAFFTAYLYSVLSTPSKDLKTSLFLIMFLLCHTVAIFVSPYSVYFLAGVFLSFFHSRYDKIVVRSDWTLFAIFCVIFYCFGFFYPRNAYGWVEVLLSIAKVETIRVYFYALGAIILIHLCLKHSATYGLLSNCTVRQVNIGKLLGLYSVGFYFLGLQMDFSLGSYLFVKTYQTDSYWGELVTFLLTFVALTVAAEIFGRFDTYWSAQVNRVFSHLSKIVLINR